MNAAAATHDVFISHSSGDVAIAEAAREVIEGAGHRCWIAPRDIVPGENYGEAIINGIEASRIFLLIVSGRSVASRQVERETERAANAGLAIIPFRIEAAKPSKGLEFFISSAHWLDAFEPPMEQHYAYLTQVIGLLLAGKQAGGDPAPPPRVRSAPGASFVGARRIGRRTVLMIAALLAVLAIGGFLLWRGSWGPVARCDQGDFLQRAAGIEEGKPLNLRASPSLETRVVAVIGPGETFCVASRQGDWWRARRHSGEEGYVYAPRIGVFGHSGTMGGNAQQPAPPPQANAASSVQENSQ